jgi:hypothetical protein
MKTLYIPKGETVCYETLEADRLVVKGCLKVAYDLHAKSITGGGMLDAQTIYADSICVREIEAGSVICKNLLAEQVQTPELIVSENAAVSTFLSAAYVKAGKLTVAVSEVDTVEAEEVVNLHPRRRGLLRTLLLSALLSLWLAIRKPAARRRREKTHKVPPKPQTVAEAGEALERAAANAGMVSAIMVENGLPDVENDTELKRFVSTFLLLRDQGYTLRVLPGTPEENARIVEFMPAHTAEDAAHERAA